MNERLKGWGLGIIGGAVITVLAWQFANPGFLLLSALGSVWFAGIGTVYPQGVSLLFTRQERVLTAVAVYVVIAVQTSVSGSPERALVVALIVCGMFVFGIGVGSRDTKTHTTPE